MVRAGESGDGGHKPSTGETQAGSSAIKIAATLKKIVHVVSLISGPEEETDLADLRQYSAPKELNEDGEIHDVIGSHLYPFTHTRGSSLATFRNSLNAVE